MDIDLARQADAVGADPLADAATPQSTPVRPERLRAPWEDQRNGTPVDSFDTESNYYLVCDTLWELPGPTGDVPPIQSNQANASAAIPLLGGHEWAVEKVTGDVDRDYYILSGLDGSSSAKLILHKAGARVCVGDGSTS